MLAIGIYNHLPLSTTGSLLVENHANLMLIAMETFVVSASTQAMLFFTLRHVESVLDISLLIKSVVLFQALESHSIVKHMPQHHSIILLTGICMDALELEVATRMVLLRAAVVALTGMKKEYLSLLTQILRNARIRTTTGMIKSRGLSYG